MALKRDPKCVSSDYSTSSDAFNKDKGNVVRTIDSTFKILS